MTNRERWIERVDEHGFVYYENTALVAPRKQERKDAAAGSR